jgi:3-oxoacyl-(acyl-carrier-protein) synthase
MNIYPEIAITGIGLISPLGTDQEGFFRYLRDAEKPTEITEEVAGFVPGRLIKRLNIIDPKLKVARYMDPASKNAIVAMGMATADAGISTANIAEDPYGYAIVLGTTRGACVTREGLYDSLVSRDGRLVSGTLFSHCGYNIAGAMTAIAYGIKGPNVTLAGRDDLGFSLLRRARQFLAADRSHTVFVGFSDCDGTLRSGSGPFEECAFFLCLEKMEHALARGGRILAEVTEDELTPATADREAVYGSTASDQSLAQGSVALRLPLPGIAALGDGYASILLLALLARDSEIKDRFESISVAAGPTHSQGMVKLVYQGAQNAAP